MFLEIGRVFCGLLSVQLHSVLELDFSVSQQKWMFYKPFEVPNIINSLLIFKIKYSAFSANKDKSSLFSHRF